jgi:hypothetical protein
MTGDYGDHLVITNMTGDYEDHLVITKMTGDYADYCGDYEDDW